MCMYKCYEAGPTDCGVDMAQTRRRIEKALGATTITPEKLVEIADILGVRAVKIHRADHYCYGGCWGKNPRPCFGPDQVRCIHQLRKGLHYNWVDRKSDGTTSVTPFVVTKEPYERADRGYFINVENQYRASSMSLRYTSVCSYSYGEWSTRDYITFSDDSRSLAYCHYHCQDCFHCHHDHDCHKCHKHHS